MAHASSALLLLASVSTQLLTEVASHGYLTEPPARNSGRGPANGYCPQCGNGRGTCGDGGQFGSQSNFLAAVEVPRRTYTAGELVTFSMTITANHGGFHKLYICEQQINAQTPDPEGPNGCLSKWEVENPAGGTQWGMPSGSGSFNFQGRIPQGVQCDACTMQWRWWTDVGTGEMFRNCADIKILGSGGSGGGTTSTTAATVTSTLTTTRSTTTTTSASRCRAAATAWGTTDAKCLAVCDLLPAGAWPCAGQLCDCSMSTTSTTTMRTTTSTTTTTAGNSGRCTPTPGLPPNGATASNCAQCAAGYKWWPCNTNPAICTCTGS